MDRRPRRGAAPSYRAAGTLAGALFWYGVARWLGEARLRDWADRHGRWVTLSGDDIASLERWFCRYRSWAMPVAHVIPGLRTLISIPAGIFSMPLPRFIGLTIFGAGLWNTAVAAAGNLLGSQFSEVERYLGPISSAIMVGLVISYMLQVIRFKPH